MKKVLILIGLLVTLSSFAQAQTVFIVQNPQPVMVPSSGGSVQVTLVCNFAPCYLFDGHPPVSLSTPSDCQGVVSGFHYSCPQVNGDGGVPACKNVLGFNLAQSSFDHCVVEIYWAGPQIVYTTQTASFSFGTSTFGGCCNGGVAISLQVAPTPPTSITVSPANSTIGINQTQQFTATGNYSDGSHFDLTNYATWSASGGASVSSSGLVTGNTAGSATISASYAGVSGSTNLTVSASVPPPASMAGKWVLFQTSASPTSAGHSCFDSKGTSCYELYADLNQDSNNNLSAPADPLNPGAYLAIDNANCGGGTPTITGNVSGANVGLNIAENILYGAPGGTFVFGGVYSANQPLSGWNLDGSPAPFSGTANEVIGTNASSGGCPAQDAGVAFHAWQYPSLGTSSVTLNVISQPGTLNIPVTISANITEHSDFSVTGSGTFSGVCPQSFTITSGQTIGNLYGLNGTYTNAVGGTGTFSIGLSLIIPFVASQSQLQQAGYTASGPGYALEVWSIDWSASSDGSCTADPITIGTGVASPGQVHKHERDSRDPDPHKKFSQNLWEIYKKRKNHEE